MNPPHVGGLLDWAAKKISLTKIGEIDSFLEFGSSATVSLRIRH